MEKKDCVTYLVRTYNQERYIEECINSIISESFKNKKILIIDDCSTDLTLRKIEPFCNIQEISIFQNKKNLGINGLVENFRNAILMIDTEFVCILDGDDYNIGERTTAQLKVLRESKRAMGVYSNFHKVNESSHVVKENAFNKKYPIYLSNPYCFSTLMVKTSFLKNMTFYNQYGRAFDYAIALELWKTGSLKYTNAATVGYRSSFSNMSKNEIDQLAAQYQMFQYYSDLNPDPRISLGKQISKYRYQLAKKFKGK